MFASNLNLNSETKDQINQCLSLVKKIFEQDLLGVYLYGSSTLGGLQKYSDIDVLVVSSRTTTQQEKVQLIRELLQISGIYMKSTKLPVEMTIVQKIDVNPWHYPPNFDFQYEDWLREQFELGITEPWKNKEMPDLAIIITQVALANVTLYGMGADQLFCKIPYNDFITALTQALQGLMAELSCDTRNVLLTLARIWTTVATDTIRSKSAAADWVLQRLPEHYSPVFNHAKAICSGNVQENWDNFRELVKPCVNFMKEINKRLIEIEIKNDPDRAIKLA